jgi:hypothetical protein
VAKGSDAVSEVRAHLDGVIEQAVALDRVHHRHSGRTRGGTRLTEEKHF